MTFGESSRSVSVPHNDPLVIELKVGNSQVKRVSVDSGSSADIITLECLKKLKYNEKDVTPLDQPLIGFEGNFFETDEGKVGKIQGDQQAGRECHVNSLKHRAEIDVQEDSKKRKREEGSPKNLGVYVTENPQQYERPQPAEEDEEVVIGAEPGRTVRVGKALNPETRAQVVEVLREYQDLFAYEASEMSGLDPKIMCHELNIKEGYKPVKQKLRHQGPKRCKAAAVEVKKLLEAGFIEECQYSEWLANVVLVKKPSRAWRMCVDFTDLNKACRKYNHPLPKINRLVDSTAGHALLSFMDANAGYH
ncbi:uncharacterized protein LOC104906923 [Beta vulgaris subsp. vulgaris]|uniref:uncharacterized protein LOC104906923 n=1 Tax=Beta vulgaris subsp. vulgaris TaxID=3555 RepID=UPI002036BB4E|nr:uncharacterized protein LOC104906923 [Beta vulgaris subsp. vulgaris]